MAAEGQIPPEGQTPPTEPAAPVPFQVEIDGTMMNYNAADAGHVEAAKKGQLRLTDYKTKTEELAAERRVLRASVPSGRPQSGPDSAGYSGLEGVLPSTLVGREPLGAPALYPSIGDPYTGPPTSRGRSLASYDVPQAQADPDDPMTRGDLQRALEAQGAQLMQQQEQMMTELRNQQAATAAQRRIAEMSGSDGMPGFSADAVYEAYNMAPPADQERYLRIQQGAGCDEAYRMVYHERIVPQLTSTQAPGPGGPTIEGQVSQAPQVTPPPYAEGSRAPGFDLNAPPALQEGPADMQTTIALGEMVSQLPTSEEAKKQM